MANTIKIKRSQVTATPVTLSEGELAYSYNSSTLFIGDVGGAGVTAIGGSADHLKLAGIESGAQVNTVTSVAGKTGAVTLQKANITDFVEADYVHKTGTETINGDKTFGNNIVISGNLTVNGTTTTVNSTQVDIGDNIIVLNADEVGTPSQDAGIEVERGTSTNMRLIWQESSDSWGSEVSGGAFTAFSLDGHTHTASQITDFSTAADARITAAVGSSVQAFDADLSAIAALSTTGFIKRTGAATFSTVNLSSTDISDFSTAADARANTQIAAASINALSDVVITTPSNTQVLTYNGTNWVNATPTSGVSTFTSLSDVPSSYTGHGSKFVKVNAGATALEFVADPGYLTSSSTLDGGSF